MPEGTRFPGRARRESGSDAVWLYKEGHSCHAKREEALPEIKPREAPPEKAILPVSGLLGLASPET